MLRPWKLGHPYQGMSSGPPKQNYFPNAIAIPCDNETVIKILQEERKAWERGYNNDKNIVISACSRY